MTPAEELEAVTERAKALGWTAITYWHAAAIVEAASILRGAGMQVEPVRLVEFYLRGLP